MFTCAAVSTNVVALPVGTILDRFGPRVSGFIGVFFITLGALIFAFAQDMRPVDGYIPGYLFLALGGPFIFISSFQLSNTFPQYSGLILALLTGAFDTSSAIFLFYRLIYQATNRSFWPKKFFLVYLVVPVFILIAQIFFMPKSSYKTVGELVNEAETDFEADLHDSDDDLQPHDAARVHDERRVRRESVMSEINSLLGTKGGEAQSKKEEEKKHISGVWGALHGKTAAQQIASPWFILITLFTVVQMTRINFFVATIRPQYEYLLGDYDKAVQINSFFDIALPLGGVISVPFIGLVLDNTSTTLVLGLLVTTATTIGVLGVIPQVWAAYANVIVFVLYRPFYYTTVSSVPSTSLLFTGNADPPRSDYSAKVFGFATFGKVYGLIICLAGLLNFSQSALDALTHKVFDNNPIPVNLILLGVALIIGVALVGFVYRKSKTLQHEMLNEEAFAAQENERLMPGADMGTTREEEDVVPEDRRGRTYGTVNGRT